MDRVPEPADKTVDRLDRRLVWLRVAGAVVDGWPVPNELRFNGDTSQIIVVNVASVADADRWAQFFGQSMAHHGKRPDGGAYVQHFVDWHGWSVQVTGSDPAPVEMTPEDEAIAADIRTAVTE